MPRLISAILIGTSAGLMASGVAIADERRGYGFGRSATEAEIAAWDIDVGPTGAGLPPGSGTVQKGAVIYANKCASCHGPTGTEGPKNQLIGGQGTLATAEPIKTIGSYWPYATTLFDYIQRAMPLTAPQSLTPNEVYSLVAWLLHKNGIIGQDVVMNAATLSAVKMPNRDGFIRDDHVEEVSH